MTQTFKIAKGFIGRGDTNTSEFAPKYGPSEHRLKPKRGLLVRVWEICCCKTGFVTRNGLIEIAARGTPAETFEPTLRLWCGVVSGTVECGMGYSSPFCLVCSRKMGNMRTCISILPTQISIFRKAMKFKSHSLLQAEETH